MSLQRLRRVYMMRAKGKDTPPDPPLVIRQSSKDFAETFFLRNQSKTFDFAEAFAKIGTRVAPFDRQRPANGLLDFVLIVNYVIVNSKLQHYKFLEGPTTW